VMQLNDMKETKTLTLLKTFEYADWNTDLIEIGGKEITVEGAPGHIIDGNGPAWWDGIGSNGGVDK
jgi:polygalacturonase